MTDLFDIEKMKKNNDNKLFVTLIEISLILNLLIASSIFFLNSF